MKTIKLFIILFLISFFTSCKKEKTTNPETTNPEIDNSFTNERKVQIIGYSSDAMEPFISKDDRYLFFNNLQGANNKDIFYAEMINDTTFEYKGEVQGINSSDVDANPTMDAQNNFYFISTRDLNNSNKTIYCGVFNNGIVTNLHQINGTINISTPFWINMGVEISKNENFIFVSSAKFNIGESYPTKGNIRFAIKNGNEYNIPDNEADILENINTDSSIEYAGELSSDGLELFYSQVTLSNPAVFKLFYAQRNDINEKFDTPISITAPFENNPNAIVEAPTLSNDGKRLYYHKFDGNVYSIYMLTRK